MISSLIPDTYVGHSGKLRRGLRNAVSTLCGGLPKVVASLCAAALK